MKLSGLRCAAYTDFISGRTTKNYTIIILLAAVYRMCQESGCVFVTAKRNGCCSIFQHPYRKSWGCCSTPAPPARRPGHSSCSLHEPFLPSMHDAPKTIWFLSPILSGLDLAVGRPGAQLTLICKLYVATHEKVNHKAVHVFGGRPLFGGRPGARAPWPPKSGPAYYQPIKGK